MDNYDLHFMKKLNEDTENNLSEFIDELLKRLDKIDYLCKTKTVKQRADGKLYKNPEVLEKAIKDTKSFIRLHIYKLGEYIHILKDINKQIEKILKLFLQSQQEERFFYKYIREIIKDKLKPMLITAKERFDSGNIHLLPPTT